jgi:hypothetical protein
VLAVGVAAARTTDVAIGIAEGGCDLGTVVVVHAANAPVLCGEAVWCVVDTEGLVGLRAGVAGPAVACWCIGEVSTVAVVAAAHTLTRLDDDDLPF